MRETTGTRPILVIGVGNSIQMDDGVGVHAIEALTHRSLPDKVELFDGGTAGLDLLPTLQDRDTVIVIDAVDAGLEPGTLLRFTPEDIATKKQHYDSLHQLGLIETLRMAKLLGSEPATAVILGVQPGVVDWGEELSPAVKDRFQRLLEITLEEIWKAVQRLQENESQNA